MRAGSIPSLGEYEASDGEQTTYSVYLECRPLAAPDAVLLVTQIVPGVSYNDELPARLALLETIEV